MSTGQAGAEIGIGIWTTLNCNHEAPIVTQPYSIMPMNSGKDFKARPTDVAQPIMAGGQTHGNQGGDVIVTHSLRGEGFDASEDGTGRGTPLVPVAFAHQAGGTQTTLGYDPDSGTAPTLNKSQTAAVAYGLPGNWIGRKPENGGNAVEPMHDLSPNLTSTDRHAVSTSMQVRRLTPVECERLQGFPDSYTDIKPNGKPTADGPRYKALGNSMAVPVMAWIGKRIQQVESI